MQQGFTTVPFTTESTHGLTSVNGVAKFSAAGVVLEFEAKLFGLISDGVKDAKLAIGDILDIKFKKGFLRRSAKIEIRTRSLHALNGIPNTDGVLKLKIKAFDIDPARDGVEKVQRAMSAHAAELPPPDPPLRSLFDASENDTEKLDQ